jgi:hypothetical protein
MTGISVYRLGSGQTAFHAVGLGAFAAVIHWCIREQPVPRLAMAGAPA